MYLLDERNFNEGSKREVTPFIGDYPREEPVIEHSVQFLMKGCDKFHTFKSLVIKLPFGLGENLVIWSFEFVV